MKILFVANEIPFPPDNGVRIVSHNAMRLMHEAGHELALAVLTEEKGDLQPRFDTIARYCAPGMAFWMPLPARSRLAVQFEASLLGELFFVRRYFCRDFRQRLAALIRDFAPDVIHFDIITMLQYHALAPRGTGTVASINDSYALTLENSLAAGSYSRLQRLYRLQQYRQTRAYERNFYPQFDAVHLMSQVDAGYLLALNPRIEPVVIPNGAEDSLFEASTATARQTNVIFVAKLVGENLVNLRLFLEHGWPAIHRSHPAVQLHIIGGIGPQAEALVQEYSGSQSVLFKGYAESLLGAYSECGIAVVPIDKNCGIINKAIEAMAAGLAVVGFEKAFAGMPEMAAGVHYLAATDFAGIGRAVVDLIEDNELRARVQRAAHEIAARHYSWESRKSAYEAMYRGAIERSRAR